MVLKNDMKKGDIISIKDIDFKRPSNGLPPNSLELILGKKITDNYKKNTLVNLQMIK